MRLPINVLELKNFFSVFMTESDDLYCPIDLPSTCRNMTEIRDSCCFEYPGGVFIQSQFWNYRPSQVGLNDSQIVSELGPLDSFTVHGLWPDNCDGSYEQFCRKELFIDDVYYLLNNGNFEGTEELYDYMDLTWKSNVVGGSESLWIHEFNKHGSCIKNLYSNCYERWYSSEMKSDENEKLWKQRGVIDYFNTTVNLFKKLHTYKALENHGIVPSIDTTYSKLEIEAALKESFDNKEVFINCDRNNIINEIWYYHLLQGSFLNEEFVPISVDELGKKKPSSRCKNDGIRYYPKGYIPKGRIPNPPRNGQRGVIRLSTKGEEEKIGFLIKNGHWMTRGTPSNYQLIKSPFGNYNLKSRLGYCATDNNDEFGCHFKNVQQASQFEYNEETGFIGYSNKFEWGSSNKPRNSEQEKLYIVTDDDNELDYKYKLQMKFIAL